MIRKLLNQSVYFNGLGVFLEKIYLNPVENRLEIVGTPLNETDEQMLLSMAFVPYVDSDQPLSTGIGQWRDNSTGQVHAYAELDSLIPSNVTLDFNGNVHYSEPRTWEIVLEDDEIIRAGSLSD